MKNVSEKITRNKEYSIRMIQFGEGKFLRAFVDYMIDVANEKGCMDCGIAIIKPRSGGARSLSV